MFGTVIDKRMLVKLAIGMAGGVSTVITYLMAVGGEGEDTLRFCEDLMNRTKGVSQVS